MNRNIFRYVIGIFAVGALACSDHGISTVVQPTEVALAPATLAVGDTIGAGAVWANASSTAPGTWASSDSSVVTVLGDGTLIGRAAGTAVISAFRSGSTSTATVSVVTRSYSGITIAVSIDAASIAVGGSAQAVATIRDSRGVTLTGRTVVWSSSDASVASVSSSGIISGIASGSAHIYANYRSTWGNATIVVANAGSAAPVSSITVSLGSPSIAVGTRTMATASLRDAVGNALTGRAVAWSSTNPSVATVSSTGDVTAIASGTSTIVATSESKLGHTDITVSSSAVVPVASAALVLPATILTVGQTTQAVVTLRDAAGAVLTGRVITWSSAAAGTASVSSGGLVTALTSGTVTISAMSEGVSATTALTVSPSTGNGTLLRSINFEGYSSTAALNADCTTFDCVEQNLSDNAGVTGYNAGDVTLDAAANPPGGTKAMRYHYNHPGNGCNSITLRRSFTLPVARQEVWGEFQVRWSSNFTTNNATCPPNDHKLIFGDTEADANYRWALYVGSQGPGTHLITAEVPMGGTPGDGPFFIASDPQPTWAQAEPLWDGNWHVIRMHMKASTTASSNDGQFHIWIDGFQIVNKTGFSITRNDGTSNGDKITGFSFAHNKDDGPPNVDMYMWWGAIKVYGTNPGW